LFAVKLQGKQGGNMFDLFEEADSTAWLDEMIADVEQAAKHQKPAEA
jgi:hypothetical protein